jgi:hypothetical protein
MLHKFAATVRLSGEQVCNLFKALQDPDHEGKCMELDAATLIVAKDGVMYLSISDDDFADMEADDKEFGSSDFIQAIRL